jgi:hypothetical protein
MPKETAAKGRQTIGVLQLVNHTLKDAWSCRKNRNNGPGSDFSDNRKASAILVPGS